MEGYRTLTNIPLTQAFKDLDKCLPTNAYKKIEGGKGAKLDLTDIQPAWLPELLLKTFGPAGVGWGFDILDLTTTPKGDRDHTTTCTVAVWYNYIDKANMILRSDPIKAPGGSTNSQIEWSQKGAVTNALGTAWFFMGYQLSVYKGERGHNGDNSRMGQEDIANFFTGLDQCQNVKEISDHWKANRARLIATGTDEAVTALSRVVAEVGIKAKEVTGLNQFYLDHKTDIDSGPKELLAVFKQAKERLNTSKAA